MTRSLLFTLCILVVAPAALGQTPNSTVRQATITACKPGTGVRLYKHFLSIRAYKRLPCGSTVEVLHYEPGKVALVRQGDVQGYIQTWHISGDGGGVAQTALSALAAGAKGYGQAVMGPEQRKCYEKLEYRVAELRAQGATEEQLADVKEKGEKVCALPPAPKKPNPVCVPFDPQRGELCSNYDNVRCYLLVDPRTGEACKP